MTTDRETIAVYDAETSRYAAMMESEGEEPGLAGFIADLPEGGLVLDLGCGPGNASAAMRKAGLRVDPVDASREMVKLANATYDIGARVATFDDVTESDAYDGVWANFSLLHAPANRFPDHLKQLHDALKSGGLFHIGMKMGDGESRDGLGRRYAYYSEETLNTLLKAAGFTRVRSQTGEGVGLSGETSPWVIILSRK